MTSTKRSALAGILSAIAFAIPATGTVLAAAPDSRSATLTRMAVVEQPRAFSYVIGDVFSQRILLQIDGKRFEPATMPPTERVGVWLERRAFSVETNLDGRDWLTVDYQIINSPQQPAWVSVPAWRLPSKSGSDALRIGEWRISASPLSPFESFSTDSPKGLRPDRPAPGISTKPIQRQVAFWSGASLLTVLTWLSWFVWRNFQTSRERPFGRALREMRPLDDKSPLAWRALHRAFDRVAGQVTQTATLAILFEKAPQLSPLQSKIETFFEQSSALFFGEGLPPNPMSIRKLCAELRRIEKRHE